MANLKFINLSKVAPILLGASFIAAQAQPVFAQSVNNSEQELLEQIDNYNNEGNSNSLNQVNSVFQLRDVSPGDWAFEALRNLVERYGCIAGYPDGTYRGNRALTRFEFAAGLNACLQQIERLIAANTGGGGSNIDRGDLATLNRLVQEFEAELATLGTRVDNLEGRVGFLEDNQFSTTTKLSGSVVFLNAVAFGGDADDPIGDVDGNVGFVYDAVLDFEASFTGRDELKVSLQAAEFGGFESGGAPTDDAALDNADDTDGSFEMEDLIYSFPLGQNIQVEIGALDFDPDSAFDYSYGSGATFSDFTIDGEEAITDGTGTEDDTGISINVGLTDRLSFGVGYTTNDTNANDPDIGLFQDYSLASGLNYSGNNFDIGIGYNLTQTGAPTVDDTQNAIGARGAVRLGARTEIGGFVEYIDRDVNVLNSVGDSSTDGWSFGANLAFFDIGREGSTLGLAFASRAFYEDIESEDNVNPDNDPDLFLDGLQDLDRTFIAEVFYDFPVNDNVSITPGLVAVFNANGNADNSEVFVGVVRTSFSF